METTFRLGTGSGGGGGGDDYGDEEELELGLGLSLTSGAYTPSSNGAIRLIFLWSFACVCVYFVCVFIFQGGVGLQPDSLFGFIAFKVCTACIYGWISWKKVTVWGILNQRIFAFETGIKNFGSFRFGTCFNAFDDS